MEDDERLEVNEMKKENLLLDYKNPKEKFYNQIDEANLMRDEVIVAIIPRKLYCEICGKDTSRVWEDPQFTRDDGSFIRHCSSCAVLLQRFSKYSDKEMNLILQG